MGNNDSAVDAAALIFEARICSEAVAMGIERMIAKTSSEIIIAELKSLQKMSTQSCDALEALQKTLIGTPPEGTA